MDDLVRRAIDRAFCDEVSKMFGVACDEQDVVAAMGRFARGMEQAQSVHRAALQQFCPPTVPPGHD